ncbi:MAG: AAA family ATPase [Burkholderiaceae bacterium]
MVTDKAAATASTPHTGAPLTTATLVLGRGSPLLRRAGAADLPLQRADAALLAVLAIDGTTSRQRLLQLLWPDKPAELARNVLRQRLFQLRRAAGIDLVRGAERIALAPQVTHDLDDDEAQGLLPGADFAEHPAFDDWLTERRRELEQRQRARLADRVAACLTDARYAEGAALAERLAAADPLDEAMARQAMTLHYLAGQRGAALSAYERFATALAADDERLRPTSETSDLLAMIRDARPLQSPARRRDMPASVLRPPRLVGRAHECVALGTAWSNDRAFWVLGEAGLGKTRLISDFIADAPDASAALVVAARPGDTGVPFATLARALRAVMARAPALREPADRGELVRVMPELPVAVSTRGASAAQPLALARAVSSLLLDAHRDGVGALVFDDMHFADAASIEMLQALVSDDALAALRWGYTQRPAEGDAALDGLRAALEESQRVETVTLAPLSDAQMAELIDSLGLPQLDAAALAAPLTRHTGGNPLYALETIKHLILSERPLDGNLPRPASIGQLIARRLRRLSPQALALARVAAVAGVDFSLELAQAVLEQRALALADAWRELESAQVLRDSAFAHDLVHEATLADVPAPIAAHTHGEVAAFLEARHGEPARVATHWLAAGQRPRALVALHAAADAARLAMRRKEEAAFLDQAASIEREAHSPAAFETLRQMIEALWASDRTALGAATYDRLEAAAGTPQQRSIALATRATWAYESNDIDGAKRLCRQAIELADQAGDEACAVQARQRLAEVLGFCGDFTGAVDTLQQLQLWFAQHASEAEQLVYYGDLAIMLDNADRAGEARVYHQRAIDIGRRVGAWSDVATALGNLAISWACAGYMGRAIELLFDALKLAAAHDEARGFGASLPIEIHNTLRDCARYAEAQRWIEPAMTAAQGQVAAWQPLVRSHIACHWIHLGQHARAQREIDAALAADAPDWIRAKALQMQARMRHAMGRPHRELIEQAYALMPATGRRNLWASIALDHALTLEPNAALDAARRIVAIGQQFAAPGTSLAGHIRAARFAVDARRAEAAATHARDAVAMADDVSPNDLFPSERWLQAWRAFTLAGDDAGARDALTRGAHWVRKTQRDHVPEPFRDSFVRANPVNQQLLRAAAAAGL